MNSAHNTNRGRNNGANGNNGGNGRRARRPLSHQRNPQNQSVVQHRTEAPPESAPARVSEVSASLEPEGMPDVYEGQSDRPIPSASNGQASLERGPVLHSIRAPFAPGQNHVHTAGNSRGQVPASGPNHDESYFLPERQPPPREPEAPTWRSSSPQRENDETGDPWFRRVVPGRSEHSSRDERPVAWSRQEQGTHEPVSFEGRDVRGDIGELIDSLHELFERDRGIASQSDTSRCGICYLHFSLSELQYREEEGFYVCPSCERALAHTRIVMVRRQQHS